MLKAIRAPPCRFEFYHVVQLQLLDNIQSKFLQDINITAHIIHIKFIQIDHHNLLSKKEKYISIETSQLNILYTI